MSIEIQGLSKRFGEKKAVDGLTLHIPSGMYGLLGPNGAGKTTLMRILCTLLTPTEGTAKMDGIPLDSRMEVRKVIGYLPQDFSFYPHFTVWDTLDYLGMLSAIKDKKKRFARIDELLDLTNLTQNRKHRLRHLSGGQRKRLGIAQMLLSDPRILVVDEPTAGLDPEERIRFRNLLSTLSAGKTVLLSTHIAEDISQTCPSVAVMNQGKLLYAGSVEALIRQADGCVWEADVNARDQKDIEARGTIVSMVSYNGRQMVRLLASGSPSADSYIVRPTLEDAYMLLIKGGPIQ